MTTQHNSRCFFFDITDVVRHALQGDNRVTGIQRVQLNLIRLMAAKYGNERIKCVCYHERRNEMVGFDADILFEASAFDGERMLFQLGIINGWRHFPSKVSVKRYLRRYANNKRLRFLKKIDIYGSALFFPSRFARTGLRRAREAFGANRPVAIHSVESMNVDDSLIFLGTNWSLPKLVEIAREHATRGGDVVQLMYDLIPIIHPEYCTHPAANDFNIWMNMVVQCVSRFVCISECTARDLHSALQKRGLARGSIVVPLAHEFDRYHRNERRGKTLPYAVTSLTEFILCVGTIEIRKNGAMLLRSWLQLHAELGNRMPKLVFAGKHGWLSDEFDQLLTDEPALRNSVIIVDAPSDDELAALYQACLFTVYPSHYEGWGLPVGESVWFGKYCITANCSSLPEVCAELVDYIEPDDQNSIIAALRRVILDPQYLQQREAQIRAATLRTWQNVVDDIWRVLMA